MLKLFSKVLVFSLSVLSILILIFGFILGNNLGSFLEVQENLENASTILGVLGVLLAFVIDVIIFGTIGLIVEIRDYLKSINNSLKKPTN